VEPTSFKSGTVQFFDDVKGWGFVTLATGEDAFVGQSRALPLVITVATPRTPRTPPYRVLTGKFVAALQPVVVVAETAPLLRGVELVPPTGARITSFRMPDALFVAYPRS
jgi:hypothetical protein